MDFKNVDFLKGALDAYSLRNQAINNNMVNVNTPNYKREVVRFEEFLNSSTNKQKLEGYMTNIKHIEIPNGGNGIPRPEKIRETSARFDKNNINVDLEMAQMAENTIKYNTVIQQMSGSFRRLRSAITDGRK